MNEETIKIIEALNLDKEAYEEIISVLERGFTIALEFNYDGWISWGEA